SRRSACSTSPAFPIASASRRAWVRSSRACPARAAALSGVAYFSFSSALMISSKISLGSIRPPLGQAMPPDRRMIVGCAERRAGLTHRTAQLNVHFLAKGEGGRLVGRGRAVRLGQRMGYGESEVTDGSGQLLARASGTFIVLPAPGAF